MPDKPETNLTSASEVFNRLAQLKLDSEHRDSQIAELEAQNEESDREWDLLESAALAFLAQRPNQAARGIAFERYTDTEYAIVNDGDCIEAYRLSRPCEYEDLTPEEVDLLTDANKLTADQEREAAFRQAVLRAADDEDESSLDRLEAELDRTRKEIAATFQLPTTGTCGAIDGDAILNIEAEKRRS